MKAILIGDHEAEIKRLTSALSKMGIDVTRFYKSQDVLEEIRSSGKTELVFVVGSMKLPDMSGFELIKKINESNSVGEAAYPFAVLSDRSDENVMRSYAVNSTCTFFVPTDLTGLKELISRFLEEDTSEP